MSNAVYVVRNKEPFVGLSDGDIEQTSCFVTRINGQHWRDDQAEHRHLKFRAALQAEPGINSN